MKIDITNQTGGVKAFLTGFSTEELEQKILFCQNGQCECTCDPQIMEKIEEIELSSDAEGSILVLKGELDAASIAPMINECLTGEKQ
ncbi:MAG: hypothetical protein AB7S65_11880 [Sulfuricurvum sp.]